LISPLNAFPWVINGLVEAHVSLKRVQRFINIQPTYLDEYYENVSIDPLPSLGKSLLFVVFVFN
jgi:ATP-binding cassette subfamily C (CFTR/MRP) protein 10